MLKPAYYNENDEYAAQWLRNLIKAGHIAPGEVDDRSIRDVRADDLRGFAQCHFFAGIGIWSHALRLAGWPDDRPVWTGSCPCQPFSNAGKRKGFEDDRHLWPVWEGLIGECRPDCILGEQVSSPDGLAWLDPVLSGLEGHGYTVGALVAPSASVGAPHGRHRIWFVADSRRGRRHALDARDHGAEAGAWAGRHDADRRGGAGQLADAAGRGRSSRRGHGSQGHGQSELAPDGGGDSGRMADTDGAGAERLGAHGGPAADPQRLSHGPAAGGSLGHASRIGQRSRRHDDAGHDGREPAAAGHVERMGHAAEPGLALWSHDQDARAAVGHEGRADGDPGPVNGWWANAEWVLCRDPQGPRWRPIEPGSFPVANGAPARVGRLRAYGNAINAAQAAALIQAFMEVRP